MTTVTVQLSVQFDIGEDKDQVTMDIIWNHLDKINEHLLSMDNGAQLLTGVVEQDYITLKSEDDE